MIVSKKYTDFTLLLERTIDYLLTDTAPSANALRLGVQITEINDMNGLQVNVKAAYDKYADPITKNAITVQAMKEQYEKVRPVFKTFQQRLSYGLVELTSEDRNVLDIPQRKRPTRNTKPTIVPFPVWVKAEKRGLVIDAVDQSEEARKREALPNGCQVAVLVAITAQGVEPTEADYQTRQPSTRSRIRLEFEVEDMGKNAYIKLAYQNTAGRGSWSQSLQAVII